MINPMFCMFVITFFVGLTAFYARVSSVKKGELKPRFFLLMREDSNSPDVVQKTTRNFNNQFEIPVLFYIVCSLHLVLNTAMEETIILAWCFVASRALHAMIHITYNNLLHRIVAYWLGVFTVAALWVLLVLNQP